MVNIRLFLYFFRKENFFNLLLFFSIPSLFFFGDLFFLLYIVQIIGLYPSLFFTLFFTAIGQIIIFKNFATLLDQLKATMAESNDCQDIYLAYGGSFFSAILLMYPGIISFFLGLFFLIPGIRKTMGRLTTRFLRIKWSEVNEYLYLLQ